MSDNFPSGVPGRKTGAQPCDARHRRRVFFLERRKTETQRRRHHTLPTPIRNPVTDDTSIRWTWGFDGQLHRVRGMPLSPGIQPIVQYLHSLPYHPDPNCQPKHFYMINNDSPGFLPDGTVDNRRHHQRGFEYRRY